MRAGTGQAPGHCSGPCASNTRQGSIREAEPEAAEEQGEKAKCPGRKADASMVMVTAKGSRDCEQPEVLSAQQAVFGETALGEPA